MFASPTIYDHHAHHPVISMAVLCPFMSLFPSLYDLHVSQVFHMSYFYFVPNLLVADIHLLMMTPARVKPGLG